MSFTSSPARSRWSDLYLASTAQFFGALGTFLVMVTLLLALQRSGASGVQVSILAVCEALPMVVLGKLIGRVVDRFDSRRLLIVAGVGQVAACIALASADRYAAVIAGAVALSTASGIAIPTRQALVPAMVNRDELPRASAIGQTAGSAGMMLGPALAGFMVGGVGPQRTIQFAAVAFVATIIGGLVIRTRRGGAATAPVSEQDGAGRGWNLRGDRLLWSSVWGLTAVVSTISAVNVVLVFFVLGTLDSSEEMYGIIDSMWTVGLALGAWVFSRMIRPSTSDEAIARRVFLVLGVMSVGIILVGSVPSALWIVPCYVLGGSQNGALNVLVGTLVGRRAPAEARGRASTAMAMRVQGGALAGFVLGGLLLELAEPRWVVIGCGALGLATVLAVAMLVTRPRHDGTVAAQQPIDAVVPV
jgi:MFS family permease